MQSAASHTKRREARELLLFFATRINVGELGTAAVGSSREAVRIFAESRAAPSDRRSAAICANVSSNAASALTGVSSGAETLSHRVRLPAA